MNQTEKSVEEVKIERLVKRALLKEITLQNKILHLRRKAKKAMSRARSI